MISIPSTRRGSKGALRTLGVSPAFRRLSVALATVVVIAACGPDGCSCEPPKNNNVTVTDERVRSCDILLRADGGELPSISFGDEVRGQSIPQAPKVGVSFAATKDAALTQAPFTFTFKSSGTVRIDREECFDAKGKKVDGTPVVLE